MNEPNLLVLLDALGADDGARTDGGVAVAEHDDRYERALEHLQSDPEAQVALYRLAWATVADRWETDAERRRELRSVAERVRDAAGVNLLRAVDESASVEDDLVPRGLLAPAVVAACDPEA